jgi:Tol biopolymer transport system component/DNA-binding winged helix-turn-helix (wHTH) protein
METTSKPGICYRFDDVSIDCASLRVEKNSQPRKITPRAFDVLVYLASQHGRIVDKQELFEQVWKESFVTDNALTRAVKEIRQVIGDDADAPRYIETVPKRGYRFIADVQIIDPKPARVASPEPTPAIAEQPAPEPVIPAPSESPRTASTPAPIVAEQANQTQARGYANRVKWMLIALAAMLIVMAVLVFWLARDKSAPTEILRTTQVTIYAGLDINPSLSPDGNSIVYSSDHSGNFEIYVKQLTPGAIERQLTSDGAQNLQPAWSPDNQRIAYYSKNRGGVWVMPASGGSARQLTEFGSRPAWSPDGAMIAFQSNALTDMGANARDAMPPSTIWIIPAQGGDAKPITQVGAPPGGHGLPVWSPDGKRLVFEVDEFNSSSIWSVAASGDDSKPLLPKVVENTANPIYAPDGQSIYYCTQGGLWQVRISPTSGAALGEPMLIAGAAPTIIKHLTISADGKKLAYSALLHSSNLMSVPLVPGASEATGAPLALTHDNSARNNFPAFSPDGQKIAYTSYRPGTNGDIWLMDADGKNPSQLTLSPANESLPSWFPTVNQIAFLSDRDGHRKLWAIDLASGRERLLFGLEQVLDYARLSPDGKQVAFNSTKDGLINVGTIPTEGGEAKQLTSDKELMGFPCWSPDGQWLAFQMKRGDDTHITLIPSGGGPITQLTFDKGQSWTHSWSPDGDKIAFAGFRNGVWNVWWVSRSTKQQKQLTAYTKLNSFVRYPAWSPLGDKIVYEYTETTGNIWVMELK